MTQPKSLDGENPSKLVMLTSTEARRARSYNGNRLAVGKIQASGRASKPGGPNYVAAFREWSNDKSGSATAANKTGSLDNTIAALIKSLNKHLPAELHDTLHASVASYSHWWLHEFSIEHDLSDLHGETNDFCYRPQPQHVLRISPVSQLTSDDFLAVASVMAACQITNCPLLISLDQPVEAIEAMLAEVSWAMAAQVRTESTDEFVDFLQSLNHGTLRILGDFKPEQFAPSVIGNIFRVSPEVLCNGRVELLNYLREQAISETVHRYGNISS